MQRCQACILGLSFACQVWRVEEVGWHVQATSYDLLRRRTPHVSFNLAHRMCKMQVFHVLFIRIVETMSYSDKVANFLDAPSHEVNKISMADLELIAGDVMEKVRSRSNSPEGTFCFLTAPNISSFIKICCFCPEAVVNRPISTQGTVRGSWNHLYVYRTGPRNQMTSEVLKEWMVFQI